MARAILPALNLCPPADPQPSLWVLGRPLCGGGADLKGRGGVGWGGLEEGQVGPQEASWRPGGRTVRALARCHAAAPIGPR